MMNKLFNNKVVVVSGGLGDIGQAIALAFAGHGASVALCGMRPSSEATSFLNQVKDKYGVPCIYEQVDVSDPEKVKQWLQLVEDQLGTPSLIIANAATVTLANILEITADQWLREINVNLNGAFFLAQHAARRLVEEHLSGHVVFIGSWAGHAVHANMPAYSVSKAAMRMLCKCMALELASHDIMVNELAPGYVQAGLSGKVWEQNPGQCEQAALKVPTGKIMSADEVADQVIYLCRPENKHITGSTLLMDGGLSLLC